jgi:hypothetical protein
MINDRRESRVILSDDQHAILTAAANRSGMALSTYLRHCALEDASSRRAKSEAD